MPATTIQLILEGQDQASAAIQKVNAEVAALGQTAAVAGTQTGPDVLAVQKLGTAAAASATDLQTMARTATATKQSMAVLRSTVTLLGLQAFPQFTTAVFAGTSALKAIRSAALLSGASLGMVTAAAGLAAAGVAGLVAIGIQYNKMLAAQRQEQQSAHDLVMQTTGNTEKLGAIAEAAYKRGTLAAGDYLKVLGLLMKATLENSNAPLAEARAILKPVVLTKADTADAEEAFKKLEALNNTLVLENLDGEEKQREAAQQTFRERTELLKKYDEMLATTGVALPPETSAALRQTLDTAATQAKAAFDKANADAAASEQARLDAEVAATAKAAEQKAQLEIQRLQEIADIRAQLGVDVLSGLDAEIAAIDKKYDDELARLEELKASLEDVNLLEEARAKAKADAKAADELSTPNQADRFAQSKGTVGTGLRDLIKPQKKLSEMEERIRAKRIQAERDMWDNFAIIAKAGGRKSFAIYKAIATAMAIVDTAKAVIGAFSSFAGMGPWGVALGIIAAAAAAAAGAVQIAVINSQTFAGGGFTGFGSKDHVAGIVHKEEFVYTKEATRALTPEFLYRQMHAAESGVGLPSFAPRTAMAPMPAFSFANGGFATGTMPDAASTDNRPAADADREQSFNFALIDDRQSRRDWEARRGIKVMIGELARRGNKVSL